MSDRIYTLYWIETAFPLAQAAEVMAGEQSSGTFVEHLRVELAIVFQEKKGAVFSDGALKAIDAALPVLFRPDWKRVFDPTAIHESVHQITRTE